jgi:hypothetical protein
MRLRRWSAKVDLARPNAINKTTDALLWRSASPVSIILSGTRPDLGEIASHCPKFEHSQLGFVVRDLSRTFLPRADVPTSHARGRGDGWILIRGHAWVSLQARPRAGAATRRTRSRQAAAYGAPVVVLLSYQHVTIPEVSRAWGQARKHKGREHDP